MFHRLSAMMAGTTRERSAVRWLHYSTQKKPSSRNELVMLCWLHGTASEVRMKAKNVKVTDSALYQCTINSVPICEVHSFESVHGYTSMLYHDL